MTAILPKTASARVPAPLLAATSRAANLTAAGQAVSGVVCSKVAVLTEGVLKTMFLTNLKTVTAVVFLLAGLIGAGLCYSTAVGQAKEESVAQAPGQGEPARQGATTDARQLLAERFEEVQKLIRPRLGNRDGWRFPGSRASGKHGKRQRRKASRCSSGPAAGAHPASIPEGRLVRAVSTLTGVRRS